MMRRAAASPPDRLMVVARPLRGPKADAPDDARPINGAAAGAEPGGGEGRDGGGAEPNPLAAMADAVLHAGVAQSSALVTKAALLEVYRFRRAVTLAHALGAVMPAICVMYAPTGVLMSQIPDAIAAMVHVKPKPPQYLKAPAAAVAPLAAFAVAVPGGVKAVPATMLAHVDASMYVPPLALPALHTEGKLAVRLPALQKSGPDAT